jgi:very-short-patch-repair endonuclease
MRGLRLHEAERAQSLRRAASAAEARLWARLRARRLNGLKFVRQEPIGPYFADFVCREAKLVVEVDGATHSTEAEIRGDARRSAFLRQEGYRVARLHNDTVMSDMDGALETILAEIAAREGSRRA